MEPKELYLKVNNKCILIRYDDMFMLRSCKSPFLCSTSKFSLCNENVFLYKGHLGVEIQNVSLANYVGPFGLTSGLIFSIFLVPGIGFGREFDI